MRPNILSWFGPSPNAASKAVVTLWRFQCIGSAGWGSSGNPRAAAILAAVPHSCCHAACICWIVGMIAIERYVKQKAITIKTSNVVERMTCHYCACIMIQLKHDQWLYWWSFYIHEGHQISWLFQGNIFSCNIFDSIFMSISWTWLYLILVMSVLCLPIKCRICTSNSKYYVPKLWWYPGCKGPQNARSSVQKVIMFVWVSIFCWGYSTSDVTWPCRIL